MLSMCVLYLYCCVSASCQAWSGEVRVSSTAAGLLRQTRRLHDRHEKLCV